MSAEVEHDAAEKARAEQLEAQVEEILHPQGARNKQPSGKVNPREFIQRRMAELAAQEKEKRPKSQK